MNISHIVTAWETFTQITAPDLVLEAQLAIGPAITVPTTLLIGADDGIVQPRPGDERWRAHFTGKATRHPLE